MDDPTHDSRCRLYTANHLDGLCEEIAEARWEARRHGTLDDLTRAQARSTQGIFRDFGATAVDAMLDRHRERGEARTIGTPGEFENLEII